MKSTTSFPSTTSNLTIRIRSSREAFVLVNGTFEGVDAASSGGFAKLTASQQDPSATTQLNPAVDPGDPNANVLFTKIGESE